MYTNDKSGYGKYCNSDNGWCGDTEVHRDTQSAEDKYDFEPASCSLDDGLKEQLAISKCAVDYYPRKDLVNIKELGPYHRCLCDVAYDYANTMDVTLCLCDYAYSGQPADQGNCKTAFGIFGKCNACCTNNCGHFCPDECDDGSSSARMEAKGLLDSPAAYDRLRGGIIDVYRISSIIRSVVCVYVTVNPGTASEAATTSNVASSTGLYVMGVLICLALACIASLLCFAICIRPLLAIGPLGGRQKMNGHDSDQL